MPIYLRSGQHTRRHRMPIHLVAAFCCQLNICCVALAEGFERQECQHQLSALQRMMLCIACIRSDIGKTACCQCACWRAMCIGLHIYPHTGLTARIGLPRICWLRRPSGHFWLVDQLVVCRALGGRASAMPHSFLCCHVRSVCCGVLCLVEVLAVAHACSGLCMYQWWCVGALFF